MVYITLKKSLCMASPEPSDRRNCRSPEVQDILERSTKKTKRLPAMEEPNDMEGITRGIPLQTPPNSSDHHMLAGADSEEAMAGMSYKTILTGNNDRNKTETSEEEMAYDDEKEEEDKESDTDCPVIKLTKEEKARLRKPWRQSLIIKVMGKRVGYAYLLRRLVTIWHPKSKIELITLENDYFLVKLGSVIDYEFAKYGGPWMIMEHYLIVKEWRPNFDPNTDTNEKVIVWVRFPDLPIEYYDQDFLFRVGEKIGEPIRIDSATSLTSRGKFARLCVEVDIRKPLLAKFWLRRRVRRIEYEGIHLVCFKCGIYGHSQDMCNDGRPTAVQGDETLPEIVAGEAQEGGDTGKRKDHQPAKHTIIRLEIVDSFGHWMIAKKAPRRQNQNQGRKEGSKWGSSLQAGNGKEGKTRKEGAGEGSRFAALREENQEELEIEIIKEARGVDKPEKESSHEPNKVQRAKGKMSGV